MIRSLALAGALCCAFVTPLRAETCIASQYGIGDGYHGRRTASGERFNTHALTAVGSCRPARALLDLVIHEPGWDRTVTAGEIECAARHRRAKKDPPARPNNT